MRVFLYLFALLSNLNFANTVFVCLDDINPCYIAVGIATELLYHPSHTQSLNIHSTPDPKSIEVLNAWNIQESLDIQVLDAHALGNAELILTMTQKDKEQLIHSYPQLLGKVSSLSQCAVGKNIDILSLQGKGIRHYEQLRNQIFEFEDMISVKGWNCDTGHH